MGLLKKLCGLSYWYWARPTATVALEKRRRCDDAVGTLEDIAAARCSFSDPSNTRVVPVTR